MTPRELKHFRAKQMKRARQHLGLSQSELASELGLADSQAVRRWEKGQRSISGPVLVAIEFMLGLREPMSRTMDEPNFLRFDLGFPDDD